MNSKLAKKLRRVSNSETRYIADPKQVKRIELGFSLNRHGNQILQVPIKNISEYKALKREVRILKR